MSFAEFLEQRFYRTPPVATSSEKRRYLLYSHFKGNTSHHAFGNLFKVEKSFLGNLLFADDTIVLQFIIFRIVYLLKIATPT